MQVNFLILENKLGSEGIKLLSDELKFLPNLSYLNISGINYILLGNKIGSEGVLMLCNNLKNIPNLLELGIEGKIYK